MSKTLRLIFLGAGFSKPAGLPLGAEPFTHVRDVLRNSYGSNNHVENDLRRYAKYVYDCEGRSIDIEDIDYEQFLEYLDIEHVLGLKGKNTWSAEGNESQLMVRQGIAEVLYNLTPRDPPPLYREFVRYLTTTDMILTFNYDTLLESALEAERVPYRLFPERFSEIGWGYNTVDNSKDELVVLKLHGSINWFDRAPYEARVADSNACPTPYTVKHAIFGEDSVVRSIPLTEGPRTEGDPLANIYQVKDLSPLFQHGFWEYCPLILPPSQGKILYSQPLRGLWWDLQRMGGLNLGLAVVGYSLPDYDRYARQALYHIFSNYTELEPNLELEGRRKRPARILDYRPKSDPGTDIRARYRFANWRRTELCLDGLDQSTLDWLLE